MLGLERMFELRFERLLAPLLLLVGIVSLVTALALAMLWPQAPPGGPGRDATGRGK